MTTPTSAPTAATASGTGVSGTTAAATVAVRYFAAAAEAAGVDTETVPAGTAALVVAELTRRHPDLAAVLSRCALLADGTRVEGDDEVRAGVTLDVLPPFAGG
ncbi:MoaD/ThiS family protein [Cellulomonas algicola]|uniref:Molybdopterin synthase sulfur carrier subunit n=1 Tax=Cellulomonas algicola TaxID=2071633 RepID=A0A401V5C5_9CELL|nr:MoaD/ThiS family protein [Cellulomonas algicola]GCD22104.1 hypothetical protein CTKZ_36660 [Cellulomonas algicola]